MRRVVIDARRARAAAPAPALAAFNEEAEGHAQAAPLTIGIPALASTAWTCAFLLFGRCLSCAGRAHSASAADAGAGFREPSSRSPRVRITLIGLGRSRERSAPQRAGYDLERTAVGRFDALAVAPARRHRRGSPQDAKCCASSPSQPSAQPKTQHKSPRSASILGAARSTRGATPRTTGTVLIITA